MGGKVLSPLGCERGTQSTLSTLPRRPRRRLRSYDVGHRPRGQDQGGGHHAERVRVKYLRIASLAEAVDAMADFADEAKLLAGGQSLVPMMSAGFLRPDVLVDLNGVAELGRVSVGD